MHDDVFEVFSYFRVRFIHHQYSSYAIPYSYLNWNKQAVLVLLLKKNNLSNRKKNCLEFFFFFPLSHLIEI